LIIQFITYLHAYFIIKIHITWVSRQETRKYLIRNTTTQQIVLT